VNSALVLAYWMIGREIVEVDQQGSLRARYGESTVRQLSARFGRGFSVPSLKRMRRFYLSYASGPGTVPLVVGINEKEDQQIGSPVVSQLGRHKFSPSLGWNHYLILMSVESTNARAFYEHEAVNAGWSSLDIKHQIASLLYERLAASRDKDRVLALARSGQEIVTPRDVIKDPVVLEFLGLPERPQWSERDLEQAIIDHLQDFLLELGQGFCFVARQHRITLDDDHFFVVDLVLYNRLLRCFVVVDLKLCRLTHRDLGQLQMYVNWFDRTQRAEHEARTIGIALCSRKNDAVVRMTLPDVARRGRPDTRGRRSAILVFLCPGCGNARSARTGSPQDRGRCSKSTPENRCRDCC
jgi:predicted nuclease of restriction endonuclease-like (RecB) superfamily